MNDSRFHRLYIVLLLVALLFPALAIANAQSPNQWSKAKRIPNFQDTSRAPILVADTSGNIHAFNYESEGLSLGAIYYRRWNLQQGWSPSTDILVPKIGGGPQMVLGAYIDAANIIHLIYFDGTEETGDILYTHAYASVADRSQSWSTPTSIATKAGPLPSASIKGDGQGKIVVVFGGQQVGIGVYEVHTTDGGNLWSSPHWVSLINVQEEWPFSISAELDSAGRLHVVWGVVSSEGVGVEVRYIRMRSDFSGWDKETILARREGNDYSTTWPTIITTGENALMVIYQDSFPATRWMVQSIDGGDSWGPPVRPFPEIGEYEKAILLKDSDQNIHLILGNRTQNPEIHGMWRSRWVNNRWTALEPILSGPISSSFDPSAPQAVIAQGNILMATWWNNVRRDKLTGAWYSYIVLDAPQLPYETLIVPTQAPTSPLLAPVTSEAPLPTPTITSTPVPPEILGNDAGKTTNPSLPIFAGIAPVVILVVVFVAIRIRNERYK